MEKIEEKIKNLNINDRVEAKLINDKLGKRYIGRYTRDSSTYFYMVDDSDTKIVIPLGLIEDIIKL